MEDTKSLGPGTRRTQTHSPPTWKKTWPAPAKELLRHFVNFHQCHACRVVRPGNLNRIRARGKADEHRAVPAPFSERKRSDGSSSVANRRSIGCTIPCAAGCDALRTGK